MIQSIRGGRIISVLIPTGFSPENNGKDKLTFRPIWSRAFRVHDARTRELKAVYIELESGKFEVAATGVAPRDFTSCGPGVSEEAAYAAENEVKSLLDSMPGNPIVQKLAQYLTQSFKPTKS